MRDVKRFEILIETLHAPKAQKALEELGVRGYAVVRDVAGNHDGSVRDGDGVTSVDHLTWIVATCPADVEKQLADRLRPMLRRYGGSCVISDARRLEL